ncbi:hypothetical protein M9H77_11054 [Catharanthus roseus]|uniref:Uncharacterized protein n=1 Tax=Catharanthus roseus TaxID=4058 RepID=A0ACC0BDI5_CATRO|nr:hypothetical protein M9H77_11054 [Catharanthus roseus]
MWFSKYLFLERNWARDESTLKGFYLLYLIPYAVILQRLKDFPQPFWLALFVEGTCFTQKELLTAQEYATSTGLPVLRNVLIPRTKPSCSGEGVEVNREGRRYVTGIEIGGKGREKRIKEEQSKRKHCRLKFKKSLD